ncbi:TlpA family protein disulfide reductase [Subdoligranulum variabile]|uniref:Antioxidant, AhpC/TSA family n=1 Tax=Subdoligranulum variabile DSM 15176 TaxID=411471 RepID=D1PIS9_9FIRM|nr:TlpA disulfide reductase family protein [Subdoligranulum variabile]EFB77438.1 antioxidant, AhpC/TSA family [Subdoligranulum variabile DSM 15176]UWP67327.1 TlpA family protein disulfide reductase [Subdoligranulum variabile]
MRNKVTGILVALLVVLIVGAGILYKTLGSRYAPNQLAVEATPVPAQTASPEQTAATAEAAEPTAEAVQTAPDFTAYDADGNAVKLSDYFGKPLVLNFWASWCGPCQSEMPEFQQKYEELADVQFLMVNMTTGRETKEDAQALLAQEGYTFPVLFDTDADAAMTYSVYSLPTTYFIAADGTITAWARGAIDGDTLQKGIDMIAGS